MFPYKSPTSPVLGTTRPATKFARPRSFVWTWSGARHGEARPSLAARSRIYPRRADDDVDRGVVGGKFDLRVFCRPAKGVRDARQAARHSAESLGLDGSSGAE